MTDTQRHDEPTQGLWRRFLLLLPLIVVLSFASYAYIAPRVGTYTVRFYADSAEGTASADPTIVLTERGIVEVESIGRKGSRVDVTFKALSDGKTTAYITAEPVKWTVDLTVRNGALLSGGINFNGWQAIHISTCVFLASLVALFASAFIKLWRASWYGYTMVACGGGLLFCLFQFLFFTAIIVYDDASSFKLLLIDISYMAEYFSFTSILLIAPMALLVSISNIALIRHEGRRPINLLGVAASLVWFGSFVLWFLADMFVFTGNGLLSRIFDAFFSVAISFGECLLLSTMLCAFLASRHVPKGAMDYLIVLGCGIRQDGTPCPLLAGRIDRAVSFDRAHVAKGDSPATFVPSGGQGPDEPISEARSMGEYLMRERSISPERIVLEDRSTTTRENMAFSRRVIEGHAGRAVSELSIGFSTTNYHVLRGYVCAHQAGMTVEGMGSKTKYYFWPNAFLREFAGLLVTRWKPILQTYIVIVGIYILVAFTISVL